MRMWMVEPRHMCRKHLMGEHVEMHMFLGSMLKGVSMKGYCANNLMQPLDLKIRHDALVVEMERRGYNHKSPMDGIEFRLAFQKLPFSQQSAKIDPVPAAADLFSRCSVCRALKEGQE